MNFIRRVPTWQVRLISMGLLVVLLGLAGCIQTSNVDGDVTVNFALKAGEEDIVCGESYAGIGSDPVAIQIKDARFYVSNVRLLNAQGESVPLALTDDGKWQNDSVALLDFEDGSADCSEIGNADLNTEIKGTVPADSYKGIAFELGIPFALNHQDVVAAASPLNIPALWWNWQYGYKFARIDLATDTPAPDNQFFIHLGSTGCGEAMDMSTAAEETGDEAEPTTAMTETAAAGEEAENDAHGGGGMGVTPPTTACNNPNVVTVTLTDFDPTESVIVADLATLLENVNVKQPVPQPAGCMSGVDDPDCQTLMPNFGISLADGQCVDDCVAQRLFRLE